MINTNQKVVGEDQIVTKYTLSNTTIRTTRTYNLQIRNVLSTDDGVYTCHVIFARNNIKRNIELAVRYLNENPFVVCQLLSTFNTSTQHRSNYEMGKPEDQTHRVSINCRADIGKNIFINITIMKSVHDKHLIPVYFATKEQSDVINGVDIDYPVDVTGLDGWKFWCVAQQSMMLRPVNSSTAILKKPRVKIVPLKMDSNQYRCEVESYPDVTFFRWIICEKEIGNTAVEECKVLNSTRSYVTLMDIADVDDVLILICQSQNAVGTGCGNRTITSHIEPTDMSISRQTESKDIKSGKKMARDSNLVKWCIGGTVLLIFFLSVLILIYFYKRFCNTVPADVTDDQYTNLQFDTNQRQNDYQELGKQFTTSPINNCEAQYIEIPSVNLKGEDDNAYQIPVIKNLS
ncbi:uncharacterized protein LOC117115126 [Anneissia japonica]|uniref:uncharacterized protein LOC117115126 n=1 Tax=Anneissia japonica TaxID=1529436 RepID=UPI0014259377|nr:uncharacterized protein LOC117115126 [Anneissia japonica]